MDGIVSLVMHADFSGNPLGSFEVGLFGFLRNCDRGLTCHNETTGIYYGIYNIHCRLLTVYKKKYLQFIGIEKLEKNFIVT